MRKLPNDIPNPFQFRDELKRIEEIKEKDKTQQQRIREIIEGPEPENVMSWEHYIWRSKDPLRIKR